MARLGTPYRVVYHSKNGIAGLTGLTAQVLKPNGSVIGVFPLSPLPGGSFFNGLYYFDLITATTDPEGEWVGYISSPTEGIKAPFRISFELDRTALILSNIQQLLGQGITLEYKAVVEESIELNGYVQSTPEIVAAVEIEEVSGITEGEALVGVGIELEPDVQGEIN